MKQIIMTSPSSFAVQYEINPHMQDKIDTVDITKAVQQWSELRNVLLEYGADVVVLPKPAPNCPDAVFTANAGLIYQNDFIPSRFKHSERQVEEPFFTNWFYEHSYDVISYSIDTAFEGAGDALFNLDRNILWMGFGFRSSLNFKPHLDRHFENTNTIVRALELVDPRFYHLDTCFCPLDTGELLWYPDAFSEYSQGVISSWYEGLMIPVTEQDAVRFGCNAISIDSTIIMPLVSVELSKQLAEKGYEVVELDMSEFIKSGGACKCLTLEVIE